MKTKILILLGAICIGLVSCNPYKRISLTGGEFYGRNKVIKNIDKYNVYVHEADSVYEIEDPQVNENNEITGELVKVDNEKINAISPSDTTKIKFMNERDDIHIYLDEGESIPKEAVTLKESEVESVILSGKEKNGALGIVLTILLAFLIILGVGIAILLIAVAAASADSGSDSGGSDSGGSDSDSGCYIATMAYGSYEAPEVLVLRKFRDQFLEKFAAGRSFIQWYYRNSPGFVKKHQSKQWLHKTLRKALSAFVFILKPFFK